MKVNVGPFLRGGRKIGIGIGIYRVTATVGPDTDCDTDADWKSANSAEFGIAIAPPQKATADNYKLRTLWSIL